MVVHRKYITNFEVFVFNFCAIKFVIKNKLSYFLSFILVKHNTDKKCEILLKNFLRNQNSHFWETSIVISAVTR